MILSVVACEVLSLQQGDLVRAGQVLSSQRGVARVVVDPIRRQLVVDYERQHTSAGRLRELALGSARRRSYAPQWLALAPRLAAIPSWVAAVV